MDSKNVKNIFRLVFDTDEESVEYGRIKDREIAKGIGEWENSEEFLDLEPEN